MLFPTRERVRPTLFYMLLFSTSSTQFAHKMSFKKITNAIPTMSILPTATRSFGTWLVPPLILLHSWRGNLLQVGCAIFVSSGSNRLVKMLIGSCFMGLMMTMPIAALPPTRVRPLCSRAVNAAAVSLRIKPPPWPPPPWPSWQQATLPAVPTLQRANLDDSDVVMTSAITYYCPCLLYTSDAADE